MHRLQEKKLIRGKALVKAIQDKEHDSDYATAFKAVIEEVAYTWFNRLIAIWLHGSQ